MDASMNTTTTRCSPQPQPHHDIFSPLPRPPPTLAAASGGAPPLLLLHWPDGSSNLPLPSRDSVSYPPTTATPKKPKPPRRKLDAASTSTPPCTECGKRFSSWKALFGHMRCHPERQWRGINPPPHFHRSSSPGAARFSDEEYQVAASLIILANGPPTDGSSIDLTVDSKAVFRHKNPRSEGEEREEGDIERGLESLHCCWGGEANRERGFEQPSLLSLRGRGERERGTYWAAGVIVVGVIIELIGNGELWGKISK